MPASESDEGSFFTFLYKKQWVHSRKTPFLEVQRRYAEVDPGRYDVFLCLSSDFLYGLEYLLQRKIKKESVILLVFLDFSFLKTLLEYRDLGFLEPHVDRLHFQVLEGVHPQNEAFLKASGKTFVIDNLTMNHLSGGVLERFKEDYYQNVESQYGSMLTHFFFEKVWLKNALENVSFNRSIHSFRDLKNRLKGEKVILLGAGVSLYECLADLKEKQNEYHLVACDSVLPIISRHGIRADFITSQDGGYYNYLDFLRQEPPFSDRAPLLMDICAYPKILREYPCEAFLYRSHNKGDENGMVELFSKEIGIDEIIPSIETSSTIIHTSISLLKYMGAEEIILMGVDMGYASFHTHCIGAISFYFFYSQTQRLKPLSHLEFEASRLESGSLESATKGRRFLHMTRQSQIHFQALKKIVLEAQNVFFYKSFLKQDDDLDLLKIEDMNTSVKHFLKTSYKTIDIDVSALRVKLESLAQRVGELLLSLERGRIVKKEECLEDFKKTPFLFYAFVSTERSLLRSNLDENVKNRILLREIFNYLHILLEKFR